MMMSFITMIFYTIPHSHSFRLDRLEILQIEIKIGCSLMQNTGNIKSMQKCHIVWTAAVVVRDSR